MGQIRVIISLISHLQEVHVVREEPEGHGHLLCWYDIRDKSSKAFLGSMSLS